MPDYTCETCAKVFKQKSGFLAHQNRKKSCSETTAINEVISHQVAVQVKEAVKKSLASKQPVTKENLQSFFEDLHNLLWNRAGLNPEKALEHMIFFFAYRMIELQADALNLPQECRWSFIASLKDENELFSTIRAGVASFRSKPKTKPFFKMHELQKAELVYDIVEQINRVTLETLQETDVLGDIFEHMLSRGMSTMSDEGQYFTSRVICRLAFKLAYDIKKTVRRSDGSLCTFADWFCGTGGFAAEYVKGVKQVLGPSKLNWKKDSASIYCQDMNLSSITTTLLNLLIMTGQPFGTETIRNANSFSDSITLGPDAPFKGLRVDYCFLNPPYGGDKTKGKEYKFAYTKGKGTEKQYLVNLDIRSIGIEDDDKVSAGVQLAMATLSVEGGVCAIVLPQGFFFGASKKAIELRKKITEEYKIHYVVDIAAGAFANTTTKTSMLVFQRGVGPTETVQFLDIAEKVLVEASLKDLQAKHYSLNYKQYVAQEAVEVEGFEMVKLETLLKKKTYPKHPTEYGKESGKFRFHTGAEFTKLYTDTPDIDDLVIIVNRTNGSGKSHIFIDSKCSVAGQTIVFSCNDDTTTKYVYYYLKNNIKILEDGYVGANHKNLTIQHVHEIHIPLPSLERQKQIVEAIDGWTTIACQEEEILKILEKQILFQVKEMGRGQERVKLGDVCEFKRGKMITKKDLVDGEFPVIGGGLTPMGYHNVSNRDAYTTLISQSGENAGHISRYTSPVWASDCFSVTSERMNMDFLYYSMKQIQEDIHFLKTGTAQPHIYPSSIESLTLPIPSLAEQLTLQSDFDEIRHKHVKISLYKQKAQEAVQRWIPTVNSA